MSLFFFLGLSVGKDKQVADNFSVHVLFLSLFFCHSLCVCWYMGTILSRDRRPIVSAISRITWLQICCWSKQKEQQVFAIKWDENFSHQKRKSLTCPFYVCLSLCVFILLVYPVCTNHIFCGLNHKAFSLRKKKSRAYPIAAQSMHD